MKSRKKLKRKYKISFYFLFLVIIISIISYNLFFKRYIESNPNEDTKTQNVSENESRNGSESKKESTNEQKEITYPNEAYTEGVLDPQKLESKEALNQNTDLILVNKQYVLDQSYVPNLKTVNGFYLQENAASAFHKMQEAAQNDNINLIIGSSYRSYDEQNQIFSSYLKKDPYETVITYSAFPGTSEHQTGLSIDFVEGGSCDYTECFKDTSSGMWLNNNAYKYGFILRYPSGKENITGYMYEPWHYRYVGTEIAANIHSQNKTLEEYILLN